MSLGQAKLNLVSEQPLNAETPLDRLGHQITSNDLFYIRNHFDVPIINADTWTLNVNQNVRYPQQFRLDDLKALPTRRLTVLLECAGNGRSTLSPPIKGTAWGLGAVSQAEFFGISLHHLIELVQPTENAVEVLFTGADKGEVRTGEITPYARSLSLDLAKHPDVLLAWEMNGEALPRNHGYPLRMIVPNWYGMASVKWLNEISLIDRNYDGFFQTGDYVYASAEGIEDGTPIRQMMVRSLILDPVEGSTHSGGSIVVNGIAWSGNGKIVDVSISDDGGETWLTANLDIPSSKYGWTRWNCTMDINHDRRITLLSRATDAAGNLQPMQPVWNKGGYGNNPVHRVEFSTE